MQIFNLTQYEYVRVSGPDALAFLQGQVTCDMEMLSADRCLPGALCNLKGRVVADFLVVLANDECFLQITAGNAEKVCATLKKYAVFSKVELSLDAGPAAVLGIIDMSHEQSEAPQIANCDLPPWPQQPGSVMTADQICSIRLSGPDPRYQIWCWDEKQAATLAGSPSSNPAQWLRAEVLAGVVHVTAEMSEQYTPQLLNYDQSGVVDFKKGCYTGQEVVARMHYRAQAKKRLYLLQASAGGEQLSTDNEVLLGTAVNAGKGEILVHVDALNKEQTIVLMAILPTSIDNEETPISLSKNPEKNLQLLSLPYTQ
jgi:folate-binding protein YgfZ